MSGSRRVLAVTALCAVLLFVFLGSGSAAAPRTLRIPILMYHRIDRANPALPSVTQRLTVRPSAFASQIRWLKVHGYETLTESRLYAALVKGGPLPRRPVVITFDDGYSDVLTYAAPVLQRFGMRAISYAITGRVSGPDPSFLTWGQLERLERAGVEIGSHTVSHVPLTGLATSSARTELRASRSALERHLGHPVRWIAYPYGAVDARIVRLAAGAGYLLGMTTRGGSLQDGSTPLELRRAEVLDTTTLGKFAAILR
jgi:peptidoglycan/xylan/chitin deacetylase (PgdA/CDA1 family)